MRMHTHIRQFLFLPFFSFSYNSPHHMRAMYFSKWGGGGRFFIRKEKSIHRPFFSPAPSRTRWIIDRYLGNVFELNLMILE